MIASLHDDQLVLVEVLPRNVPGPAFGALEPADSDALALADGIERKPDVLADDLSLGRAHRARLLRQIAAEKLPERPLADKADSGRAALGEIVQPRLLRDCAHLGLLQFPERENHARKLLLVQAVQEIALVFGKIDGLEQLETTFRLAYPGVVPGGDALRAQRDGVIEEGPEDALLVLRGEIHDFQIDADHLGDRGAVDQVLPRRAVFVIVVVLPVLHEEADDFEPLALQQQRGDRRIDAARHAYDYPFACHLIISSPPSDLRTSLDSSVRGNDGRRFPYATRRWFFRMNSAMRATPCSIAVFEAA